MTWTEEYKAAMRDFLARMGKPVLLDNGFDGDIDEACLYGWTDRIAREHVHPYASDQPGCAWVVPPGAVLYERSYTQFLDTLHGVTDEVGVNVSGCRCRCGAYSDVILRYSGSLAQVMQEITDAPSRPEVTL